jgi:hypothetical protein
MRSNVFERSPTFCRNLSARSRISSLPAPDSDSGACEFDSGEFVSIIRASNRFPSGGAIGMEPPSFHRDNSDSISDNLSFAYAADAAAAVVPWSR